MGRAEALAKLTPDERATYEREVAEQERRWAKEDAKRQETQRWQEVGKLRRQLGDRYDQKLCDIDKFDIYHKNQRAAVASVRDIAARLTDSIKAGDGIILFGSVGTGKDRMLAWLLYQAAQRGHVCHFVNGLEMCGQFRDRIDTHQSDESYFAELCRPEVLAISDPVPPSGQLSAYDLANLYRVLDRRYRERKATWATLNALTVEDADAKLSAAVFDRLRHQATLIRFFWPSYRERAK